MRGLLATAVAIDLAHRAIVLRWETHRVSIIYAYVLWLIEPLSTMNPHLFLGVLHLYLQAHTVPSLDSFTSWQYVLT